jgi:hypothetical protein
VAKAVQDQNGNPVTGDAGRSISLAIGTNPGGGVLGCTGGLGASDSSGVASFSGCAITKAGTGYTLTASSAGLAAPSNANAFNIVAGVASQLSFTTQPTTGQNIQATGTGSFSASVAVQDQNGNTLTGDTGRSVTLAIGTNPGGGMLSCTNPASLTATDSGGVASFSGCAITLAGTGYKLTASATSMAAPSNANSFNITAGNPAFLGFANLSSGTSATCSGNLATHTNTCALHGSLGSLLSYTGNVTLLDQNGNLTTNGANVPLALTSTLGSLGVSPTATTITPGATMSPTFTASLSLGLGTVTVTGTVGSATFTSTLGP